MKNRRLGLLIALVLIGIAWWAVRRNHDITGPLGGPSPQAVFDRTPPTDDGKNPAKRVTSNLSVDQDEITQLLARAADVMRRGQQAEIDQMLARLDEMLEKAQNHPDAAIAAILDFLRSRQDAPTGGGFVIGQGGILAEATTLRVYLMDKLGVLSRKTDGSQALAAARETLRDFGSADEWAVSMRNIAWLDLASREFLQDRVNAMLHHPQWRDHPSTGMLEAFDLIVHTGALAILPELGRLVTDPASPLARAAGVALDRLATRHALELTSLLNQQPEILAAVPLKRADLFAHADLGQPLQRQQLENYLLRADVEVRERRKFLGALVQSGRFVSHNLVTPYIPPETPAQAALRLETLTHTLNEWMRDARFNALNAELATLGNTVNRIIDEIAADAN